MKNIFLIITTLLFTSILSAQEPTKQEIKAQKKSKKELVIKAQFANTLEVMESKDFVIEANYLSDKYGNKIPVVATLNFIRVEGDRAVIQIGSNSGLGSNGLGGVTAEGNLSRYTLKKDEKNKSATILFTVMTNIGIYDAVIFVGPNGNTTATITGLRSGQLNYYGDLVAADSSRVYKGTTSY